MSPVSESNTAWDLGLLHSPSRPLEVTMSTRLGAYVRQNRIDQGLNTAQLGTKIGYCNPTKGARRILNLERSGVLVEGLLDKLIQVLDLDQGAIDECVSADQDERLRAWEEWTDEPMPWTVMARPIPGVVITKNVPAEVTTLRDAIVFAQQVAVDTRTKAVWLMTSRHLWYSVRADGTWCKHEPKPGDVMLGMTLREARVSLCLERLARSRV